MAALLKTIGALELAKGGVSNLTSKAKKGNGINALAQEIISGKYKPPVQPRPGRSRRMPIRLGQKKGGGGRRARGALSASTFPRLTAMGAPGNSVMSISQIKPSMKIVARGRDTLRVRGYEPMFCTGAALSTPIGHTPYSVVAGAAKTDSTSAAASVCSVMLSPQGTATSMMGYGTKLATEALRWDNWRPNKIVVHVFGHCGTNLGGRQIGGFDGTLAQEPTDIGYILRLEGGAQFPQYCPHAEWHWDAGTSQMLWYHIDVPTSTDPFSGIAGYFYYGTDSGLTAGFAFGQFFLEYDITFGIPSATTTNNSAAWAERTRVVEKRVEECRRRVQGMLLTPEPPPPVEQTDEGVLVESDKRKPSAPPPLVPPLPVDTLRALGPIGAWGPTSDSDPSGAVLGPFGTVGGVSVSLQEEPLGLTSGAVPVVDVGTPSEDPHTWLLSTEAGALPPYGPYHVSDFGDLSNYQRGASGSWSQGDPAPRLNVGSPLVSAGVAKPSLHNATGSGTTRAVVGNMTGVVTP